MATKYTKEDICDYRDKITDEQIEELLKHCHKYQINPEICAWYDDMEDLFDDYKEHCDYTKTQTRDMMKQYKQMFCKFENEEIVKLVY